MYGRRYRKRSGYRKRSSYKPRTTAAKINKIQRVVKNLAKVTKPEYFTIDRHLAQSDVGDSSASDYVAMFMNPIAQSDQCTDGFSDGMFGTFANPNAGVIPIATIEGQKALMYSIQYTVELNKNADATQDQTVRMILLVDKEPEKTALDPGDVITNWRNVSNAATDAIEWDYTSFRNRDTQDRYRILQDYFITLTDNSPRKVFRKYMKLNKMEVQVSKTKIPQDTDGDGVDDAGEIFPYDVIDKNAIWLMAVSDDNTHPPQLIVQSRIYFSDK